MASAPEIPELPEPTKRAEFARIRKRITAALAKHKIGILPAALDAIALEMWGILEDDRATSSTLLGMSHDQYGPLDDDKILRTQIAIEIREDLKPLLCRINGREFVLDKTTRPKRTLKKP